MDALKATLAGWLTTGAKVIIALIILIVAFKIINAVARKAEKKLLDAIGHAQEYEDKDEFHSELRVLEEYADLGRDNLGYMLRLGRAYRRCNMPDKAMTCYNRCVEINPGYATIYCNLGALYFTVKDYANAVSHYEKGIKIMKESPAEYVLSDQAINLANYGAALAASGKKFKGSRYIKKAEKLGYKNGDRLRVMAGLKKVF